MAFFVPEGHNVSPLSKLFQLFMRTLAFLFLFCSFFSWSTQYLG